MELRGVELIELPALKVRSCGRASERPAAARLPANVDELEESDELDELDELEKEELEADEPVDSVEPIDADELDAGVERKLSMYLWPPPLSSDELR